MDRRTLWATVRRVTKSWTQLSRHSCIINEKIKINEKHIVIVQNSLFGNSTIRFKLNKNTEKCIWKFKNVHGSWAEGEIINHNGC